MEKTITLSLILFFSFPVFAGQMRSNDTSVIAMYHFNEGNGSNSKDESINRVNLTLAGGATFVTGKLGNCIDYDGINGKATANQITATYAGFTLVCSFFIDIKDTPTTQGIWSERSASGNIGARLVWNGVGGAYDTNLLYWVGTKGGTAMTYYPLGTELTNIAQKWHRVVVVVSNPESFIYLDGRLVKRANNTGSMVFDGSTFGWGMENDGTDPERFYFNGKIDEGGMFSMAWTSGMVKNDYQNWIGCFQYEEN